MREEDFGIDSLLCPEGKSEKQRKNWHPAANFPEVAKLLRREDFGAKAEEPAKAVGKDDQVMLVERNMDQIYALLSTRRLKSMPWVPVAAAVATACSFWLLLWLLKPPPPSAVSTRDVPLQLLPSDVAGLPAKPEVLQRLRRELESVPLAAGGKLGAAAGGKAEWSAWALDSARFVIRLTGMSGPGVPTACGLIYDSRAGTLRAQDDPAQLLLGAIEVMVPEPVELNP